MIPAILVGAGAGLVVGAIARRRAREAIARELMLGSRRLSEAVAEGRADLLATAPPQIREAIDDSVRRSLAGAGLTESRLRVLLANVRRVRRYL